MDYDYVDQLAPLELFIYFVNSVVDYNMLTGRFVNGFLTKLGGRMGFLHPYSFHKFLRMSYGEKGGHSLLIQKSGENVVFGDP